MSNRLVAHRIYKKQHVKETSRRLREEMYPESKEAVGLMDGLRKALSRKSQPGIFNQASGFKGIFQQSLEKYLEMPTDATFLKFSQEMTKFLQSKMKEQIAATGGCVVFAEHTYGEENLLLIAILTSEDREVIDDDLNLLTSSTLDYDRLRHGVRVRLSSVADNLDGVLHFVSREIDGVSDYFREFLYCENLPDSSEQGRILHGALVDVATQCKLDLEEANRIAYSYWQKCQKEKVDMTLEGLANQLMPNEPETVLNILTNEKYNLPGEFAPPPSAVMKKFIKFSFNQKGLKLEFDKNLWGGKVEVVENVVQIKDPPPALLEQIKDELLNS